MNDKMVVTFIEDMDENIKKNTKLIQVYNSVLTMINDKNCNNIRKLIVAYSYFKHSPKKSLNQIKPMMQLK
jgi:hypothetical protein